MARSLTLVLCMFLVGWLTSGLAVRRDLGGPLSPRAWLSRPAPRLSADDILSGRLPVSGPGIRVTLEEIRTASASENPNNLLIHSQDLSLILNELFSAGAEAVAINGERVVLTSAVRCVGPVIRVNDRLLSPPFHIDAVGDTAVLKSSLLMIGGIADLLARRGVRLDVDAYSVLHVPGFGGGHAPKFAVRDEVSHD